MPNQLWYPKGSSPYTHIRELRLSICPFEFSRQYAARYWQHCSNAIGSHSCTGWWHSNLVHPGEFVVPSVYSIAGGYKGTSSIALRYFLLRKTHTCVIDLGWEIACCPSLSWERISHSYEWCRWNLDLRSTPTACSPSNKIFTRYHHAKIKVIPFMKASSWLI